MKTYKLLNNILGWVIFAIAATVYLLTIEPTASFWDCPEFIASAYKLEVGHPPGNPIFMMVANLFTQLVSDVSQKAIMVNRMSAILSGLTILLLFWSITRLAKKIILQGNEEAKDTISLAQIVSILGCGAVGALAYTFSDTFWFSAVEAEVYAFSSFMTALVFWLVLKWEEVADEPGADRWLILIAYVMGLSIAVHLLNLLCIPAIVLVYYFKKYQNPNWKGSLIAIIISFAIVAVVLYGIIGGVMKVAGWFELLFVNTFTLPYSSGVVFYLIFVLGVTIWGIWESMRENFSAMRMKIAFTLAVGLYGIPFLFGDNIFWGIVLLAIIAGILFAGKKINPVSLNSVLLALFVIFIGYASFALIMIRSSSNPPMDQNSPEDIFTLRTYLAREQYGETPLLYGPTYVSDVKMDKDGNAIMKDNGPVYAQIAKHDPSEKDRYFVSSRKEEPVYVDGTTTLFPRMFDRTDANHIQGYKYWANIKGERIRIPTPEGNKIVMKPTFMENLRYFFNYQVNYMYWRYFMWNFAGRQNDIQGQGGEITKGNWITGIKFLDALRLGPQDDLPDSIVKNKGYNRFYMLPLLLGILGIFYQIYAGKKGVQGFWIVFLLFFMMGLAIVVYLNQKPGEPRERDYAYAGSFYAYAIWIGLGVAAIIRALTKYAKIPVLPAAVAGSVLCILVPIQMASQTWDDHDRSKRYTCRDFGYNYLATCEPNAIIFTMGDNDTFPLWYKQEVEGFRTDVRVCNLSYLQTDWYIDQMKREAYESAPLPISWKRTDYIQGIHEMPWIVPQIDSMSVKNALDWVKSDDLRTKRIRTQSGVIERDNIPTDLLYLPVDSAAVVKSGVVKPENYKRIVKNMLINLSDRKDSQGNTVDPAKRFLVKQEMMILDMLANNKEWSRPIYFATTVPREQYLRLGSFLRQDGIAFRLVPYNTGAKYEDDFDTDSTTAGKRLNVDTDILYDNLMHKYKWAHLDIPGVYLDENAMKMATVFRRMFGQLSSYLIEEGKKDKAKEVLDYGLKVLPDYNVPYDFYSTQAIASGYYQVGDTVKAKQIYDVLVNNSLKTLKWFSRLSPQMYGSVANEAYRELFYLQELLPIYQRLNPQAFETANKDFERYFQQYNRYMNSRQAHQKGGLNR